MATPQIVYKQIRKRPEPILAGIQLADAIVIPAGANPTSAARFVYWVGDPAATAFMMEFFPSVADAEADRNALDVSNYLEYDIHPLPTPRPSELPLLRQDGYISLRRIGTIPFTEICVKFSICQPEQEPDEVLETIISDVSLGSINLRANVSSNWNRR